MNANKKNSGGWILCPSKTFPGKFYYFNVLNGEAAWSLGDGEKKIIKNPIPKEQENHHHPEPTSPPVEPLIPLSRHSTLVFGQPGFPKVHPKPEANVIWTPIQIEVPIVVPENRVDQTQGPKSPAKMIWEFNKNLFSHASGKPLSYRFVNFENPVINFDKHNKIQNVLQLNKITEKFNTVCTEESRKNEGNFKATKTIASNTEFPIGNSFSDLRPQKQLIKETVYNIEIPSETEVQEQIEPNADCNRDHCGKNLQDDKVSFGISSERQDFGGDLRNLLLAKKRKSLDGKTNSEEVESKKQKIVRDESTPKKRVSFNLDNISSSDDDEMYFKEKGSVTIQVLRDLAGTVLMEWYLVVDAEVLLEEFSFLDSFVQIDPQCKLVIPSSAMSCVRAASRGPHAATARSILRRLNTPYFIVQSEDVAGSTPNDAILKSCIDAVNRYKHVILITKDLELLTAAKRYPIHCYHINTIKNGLAPKPKEYKQNMKITIQNTEANSMENGPAKNMLADDLNEKEKEVLKCFKQNKVNLIPKGTVTPNDISNSRISIENSKFSSNKSSFDQFSRITRQNPFTITSENATNTNKNLLINSQKETMNLRENSQIINPINSQDSNINISLNHLINSTTGVFNSMAKNKENISNEETGNKKSLTDWRSAVSDVTETTIEMDMQNLNIKEKYQKIDKNTNQTKNLNEVSHFRTSTPKNVDKIFKNRTYVFRENVEQGSNFKIQNLNFKTPMVQDRGNIEQDSNFDIQKSKFNTPLAQKSGNERDSNFEIHKSISKEPQFENRTESIFEIDVFKKPNKPLNWTKRNKSVDLSNFYVKSKVMNNRLKERMEEFLCSYKQIMEEFLSSILEKLSTSVLKCMAPPWSLYEALQCAKNVYKDHIMVKNIVDQIIGYLYEADCGIDKMKTIITPTEFIKALGCGIHLIKYLKKILQPSTDMLDSEQQLMDMLQHVEDPMMDTNEPLVKTPVVNTDFKEIRQNFVKNRTDIISYLKKHYPEWQRYEENDNTMKIVRTFGRNLNKLKLERVKAIQKTVVDENVKNDVEYNNKVLKNVDVATKNADVAINVEGGTDVGNVATNSKVSLECTKLPSGDVPPKHVGIFVMKEVDSTKNEKLEQRVKIVQEKSTCLRKQTDRHTDNDSKNIEQIKNKKPKTKSIFDFMVPKDTKNIENEREKFKVDSGILAVKINVLNNENPQDCRENNNNRFEKNESNNKDIEKNKCGRKLNMNKNDDNTKNLEIKQINGNVSKIDNNMEKGIKIVRNVYLIEEFEKRLKNNQNLDLDDLDYITFSDSRDDDDETHFSHTNNSHSNDNYDHLKNDNATDKSSSYNIDNSNSNKSNEQIGSLNQLNVKKICDKVKDTETYDINNYNYNKNKEIQMNEKENGPAGNLKNLNDCKNDENDPKNDVNERKRDKDDMTNDSGLGNESPRVYSVVKSFSSELENSVELIHTYIDGSLQEFRQGKLSDETKKRFRLKAFENHCLITKIIRGLKKLAQKDCDSNEKIISKNAEAVSKCLEQAEILQMSYIMMLSETNENNYGADINSSMSLNLSS